MDGISASLTGMQTAGQAIALGAGNVANLGSAGYRAGRLIQEALPQGGVAAEGVELSQEALEPGGSNVDLGTEAVALDTQSLAFQANAKALQAQERTLGSALDIRA